MRKKRSNERVSNMKDELTEENWKFADEIMGMVYERLREIADKFIEIFDIDLGNYIYYKIDRIKLIITFYERGCMGDPTEEEFVYKDENGCWCSEIEFTKENVLNPEKWYLGMRELKAEQDKVRDYRLRQVNCGVKNQEKNNMRN
ncbi:unnamed protein product [marine sediment metagenome]|uniref:Uncharacterized protein n=1 Tax=marine sediment metagenome TaxID=412755 RepID=X0SGX7_9ZZZZ